MAILPNLPPAKVFWLQPAVVLAARVNMPGPISWPVQDIPFDSTSAGSYLDCTPDMTVLFGSAPLLDDYGRGRLRAAPTSTVLKVNRSSQGVEDGSLDIVDNAYITVLDDFRVWSKIATIGSDHIERKDTDLLVGDLTEFPPPLSNTGAPFAGRIDATSSTMTVLLDGSGSFAVADGATIASYNWDIKDGTFAFGSVATDASVFVEFPAGFRWVALTTVDDNAKSHTSRVPVLADDPDDSLCVSGMQVTRLTRTQQGASAQLRVLQDLPRADYLDGSLVMIFEDRDPNVFGSPDPTDHSALLFWGWHSVDEASSTAQETHLRRETVLTCVDVLGRLDGLPGFPQRIEVPDEEEGLTWGEMPAANMDKFLVYLIHWHSTAASVADFFPSGTWDEYPFVLFDASGDTLYNQLQRQAARIVPDHNFTSDRYGRMEVVVNPQYQNPADRTATTQNSLTEQAWSAIEFNYNRNPRVHTLRGSALLTQTEWIGTGDDKTLLDPVFSIAPGTAPGQGGREQKLGERLAKSQQDLNDTIGHHYARMNARYGDITVTLNLNADPWDFNPAAFTWVQLITTAATAPQRGLDFETIRCLVKEVSIDYTYGEEATTWRGRVVLERETVGLPALTEVHEDALPVGEQPEPPPPFVPPDFGDPSIFYGDVAAYVVWDGARVGRTWDLQATTPVYDNISGGIDGTVRDCQYFMPSADTVGAWLMTTTGIWLCMDLLATTPVWTEVLPIEDVIAAEEVSTTGANQFKCMAHYWLQPGHLCVATGPPYTVTGASVPANANYLHAYFWVTFDYGANWTHVDMDAFTFTSDGATRCYTYAGLHGMACFRSAPTIFCARSTERTSLSTGRTAFFASLDGGLTWEKRHEFATMSLGHNQPAVGHPFPDIDSPAYASRATGTNSLWIYRSEDAWATATTLPNPSGHEGGFMVNNQVQRPNKRTFDDDHVLSLKRITAGSNADLYESHDKGATWTLLRNMNNSVITPNGWPPDVDQWVIVDSTDAPRVQLTLDNFGTLLNRTGNLVTVFGSWTSGSVGGISLPRVGLNS